MESVQRSDEGGQSLVEIAIIAPLLIFMIIGVFEIGYVLRNYLILMNVSREVARYSVRPNYINFPEPTENELENLQKSFELKSTGIISDLTDDGQLILTHTILDIGQLCQYDDSVYTITQISLWDKGYESMLSSEGRVMKLTNSEEEKLCTNFCMGCQNDEDLKLCHSTGTLGECNSPPFVIYHVLEYVSAEVFYNHKQLFGFPIISNPFTDPVLLNTQTTMRYGVGLRGDAGIYFEDK